jgi:ATP-dependent Clp protease ATP-binding subunit ClpA
MIVGRMTPQAREVVRLAYLESRELGHPMLTDEHVLLGLLRHGEGRAAELLALHGLDLDTARADLLRVGPALPPRVNPEHALRTFGIDLAELNDRLNDTFGSDAVLLAQRRVRRRPRWRGGHPRPNVLCLHSLAKRSFQIAGRLADRRGDAGVGPEHLLYGIVVDAADPLGTQLSRRSRRRLAALGLIHGRPNPLRLLLEARGIELAQLRAELSQPT